MALVLLRKVFGIFALALTVLMVSCRPNDTSTREHVIPSTLNGSSASQVELLDTDTSALVDHKPDYSFEGIVKFLASDAQQGRFPFNIGDAQDKKVLDDWLTETGISHMAQFFFQLPHPPSAGHDRVRDFLVAWMTSEGFEPAGDRGVYTHELPGGANILGIYHPQGTMDKKPQMILSAHYDHMGILCSQSGESLSPYCNGAADNAAGVAAVMHAFLKVKKELQAPVALAFWDLEEYSLRGSRKFAEAPTFPMGEVRLMINLDTIGTTLFEPLRDVHFVVGAETGGEALRHDVAEASAKVQGLEVKALSTAIGHMRNDLSSFINLGHKIPGIFLTDADGGPYHTTADEPERLLWSKAKKVSEFVSQIALQVLDRKADYPYQSPLSWLIKRPLPTHEDCKVVQELANTVIEREAKKPTLSTAAIERMTAIHADLTAWSARPAFFFTLWHKKRFGDHVQEFTSLSRARFEEDELSDVQ